MFLSVWNCIIIETLDVIDKIGIHDVLDVQKNNKNIVMN